MEPASNSTLPSSREGRNGMRNEVPPTVETEAPGCFVVPRKTEGDDLERQADPSAVRDADEPAS
jgi:hypothetical protein